MTDTLCFSANRFEIKGEKKDIQSLLSYIYGNRKVDLDCGSKKLDIHFSDSCPVVAFNESHDDCKLNNWGVSCDSTSEAILACYEDDYFSLEFVVSDGVADKWFEHIGNHLNSIKSNLFISLDYAIEDKWVGGRLEWCLEKGLTYQPYDDYEIKERLCLWD